MRRAAFGDGDEESILVIGGGIAGLTAAIEAAEAGCNVILIEKSAYLGGRAIGFNLYFPKLCPPTCGFEINFRRIKNNPRITVLTQAELEELTPGVPRLRSNRSNLAALRDRCLYAVRSLRRCLPG